MRLFFYKTAIGKIGIAEENGQITNLFFENDPIPAAAIVAESPAIKEAARQLNGYFAKKLKEFSLPLAPKGTNFERLVWKAIKNVPYGQTASYRDIAKTTGNLQAARAIGSACGKNPLPVFIPCHRIIKENGTPGGYKKGAALKIKLLELERSL